MGQYYMPYIKYADGTEKIYDDYINGEYVGAKLTEQSWLDCWYVEAVAKEVYNSEKPVRLAWVGDYSDTTDKSLHDKVWSKNAVTDNTLKSDGKFSMDGKFIVNHTKNEYIDINRYKERSLRFSEDGDVPHPLSLITAIGNGEGGGDYYSSVHEEDIGAWVMDEISIEDERPAPTYTENRVFFSDAYYYMDRFTEEKKDLNLIVAAADELKNNDSLTYQLDGVEVRITKYELWADTETPAYSAALYHTLGEDIKSDRDLFIIANNRMNLEELKAMLTEVMYGTYQVTEFEKEGQPKSDLSNVVKEFKERNAYLIEKD